MQILFMLLVIGVPLEITVAHITFDRIFAGVNVDMLGQLLLRHKRFAAHVARIRFDFHMTFLVQHVARPCIELFAAGHTFVRMYVFNVFSILLGHVETLEARRTDERSFFDIVRKSQMSEKRHRRF
jgi:hypothetical protein